MKIILVLKNKDNKKNTKKNPIIFKKTNIMKKHKKQINSKK